MKIYTFIINRTSSQPAMQRTLLIHLLKTGLNSFRIHYLIRGIFLLIILGPAVKNYGQVIENNPEVVSKSAAIYKSEKIRNFRISFISIAGFGFDKIHLGVTEQGDDVTISAGGGMGLGFEAGYTFNGLFELSAAYVYKYGELSVVVDNASGYFEHGNFMLTGKFIARIKAKSSLNYGGGLGLLNAGTMDLDFSKVTDGERYVFKYNTAVGYHVLAEFQHRFTQKWSLIAGFTIYGGNYNHMKSFTARSVSVPVNLAPPDFQNLNGSGLDIYAKISFHL
jgi:hypothetical protein